MTSRQPRPEDNQSSRFLVLYALAVAGGATAYAPFLTLLLPVRASEIAGAGAVQLLASIAFVGAIAASASNIVFGWLSDRTRNRRGWIVGGLVLSGGLLLLMGQTRSIPQLLALIFAWQVALNMMLNPLAAWAGDCVPDHQKGTLGGLLSFAPGMGALVGAVVTLPGLANGEMRLALIAAIVAAMILPALVLGKPRPMPHLTAPKGSGSFFERLDDAERPGMPVWRMWLARLLVQIAESALFSFLFLWLHRIDPRVTDNNTATIFTVVLIGAVPFAIASGRWSDRAGRPMYPLIASAFGGTLGLLVMALSPGTIGAIAGYMLFGMAAAVFLALHTSQTLRVIPRPEHRGRDLGYFNLTNTIPSLIMPGLTLAMIPLFGFRGLFLLLAGLLAVAGLLLALTRPR